MTAHSSQASAPEGAGNADTEVRASLSDLAGSEWSPAIGNGEDIFGSEHWTRGGDAVTNFSPSQLALYRAAIADHGDATLYIGRPMPRGLPGDLALRQHGRTARGSDLSDFWAVFNRLRDEEKARSEA